MPKTENTVRDPWERWKGMVLAAKERLGLTDEDIAASLAGRRRVSRQTVTKWRKDPAAMPLWAFARINRILEIDAAAAREAVVVWR